MLTLGHVAARLTPAAAWLRMRAIGFRTPKQAAILISKKCLRMGRKAFLIGSSGQLGRAIGERLLLDGWDVTCAQRGDALPHLVSLGAASVRVDREDGAALRTAFGKGADAVIDTVAYDAKHAEQLLELQGAAGQFVVISSASVYRDDRDRTIDEAKSFEDLPLMPVPIRETQPTVAPGDQTYSTKKIALERKMLDEAAVPVTIVRPCAIYGLNSKHPREWWFVKRYLDGRRQVPLAYENSVFQTSAAPNIAEVVSVAIEAAYNGVLNAGDSYAPSVHEIGATIAGALSWDCDFVTVPPAVENVGNTPWTGIHPFVLSMDAAERLGYKPRTSYAEYSPAMCRWLIEAAKDRDWREVFPVLTTYPPDFFNYDAEDAFLKR